MPRLMNDDGMQTIKASGMQRFQFSATRPERLGANEYTAVTVAVDVTGSVGPFKDELRKMLIAAVKACKKSPRSDNLLLRVILFSTRFTNNIEEIHGFKQLAEINPDDYPELECGGSTPLYDGAFSAVAGTVTYANQLMKLDFTVNGIVFVITDGCEYPYPPHNPSTATPAMIMKESRSAVADEKIESNITLLIGINAAGSSTNLQQFKDEAGFDKFMDAGEATPAKLAKLADFVSQSVSSQSQSLGTGGPSQAISATI